MLELPPPLTRYRSYLHKPTPDMNGWTLMLVYACKYLFIPSNT